MRVNTATINKMSLRQREHMARDIEQRLSEYHNHENRAVQQVPYDSLLEAHRALTTRRIW